MNNRDPIPLGDAVAEFGRDLGLPDPRVLAALMDAWPELVGPALAEHVEVRSVRDGVCTIAVDDAVWATELRYREAELLRRVREVCGGSPVASIRVVVTPPS
ncbi:MAG: DUF721 domain-containing protein [Actinomycetota bacterium]|nr:DUF721 domain-containing protein [Actinomycetota bacterium]